MITWEQVPLQEQQKLRLAFNNNPSIVKLDNIASTLQNQRDYIGALKIKQEIEAQWEYVKKAHLKDYEDVVEEAVKLSDLNLPIEILQPLLENVITIFMCCAIIETSHYDGNELLKKFNKDYSMDNFSDLVSLIDNVKKKLKYLQDTTGYMDDLYWYDCCDKFHEMVKSKARSILKKKNDIERWGKNFKKYIDGTL